MERTGSPAVSSFRDPYAEVIFSLLDASKSSEQYEDLISSLEELSRKNPNLFVSMIIDYLIIVKGSHPLINRILEIIDNIIIKGEPEAIYHLPKSPEVVLGSLIQVHEGCQSIEQISNFQSALRKAIIKADDRIIRRTVNRLQRSPIGMISASIMAPRAPDDCIQFLLSMIDSMMLKPSLATRDIISLSASISAIQELWASVKPEWLSATFHSNLAKFFQSGTNWLSTSLDNSTKKRVLLSLMCCLHIMTPEEIRDVWSSSYAILIKNSASLPKRSQRILNQVLISAVKSLQPPDSLQGWKNIFISLVSSFAERPQGSIIWKVDDQLLEIIKLGLSISAEETVSAIMEMKPGVDQIQSISAVLSASKSDVICASLIRYLQTLIGTQLSYDCTFSMLDAIIESVVHHKAKRKDIDLYISFIIACSSPFQASKVLRTSQTEALSQVVLRGQLSSRKKFKAICVNISKSYSSKFRYFLIELAVKLLPVKNPKIDSYVLSTIAFLLLEIDKAKRLKASISPILTLLDSIVSFFKGESLFEFLNSTDLKEVINYLGRRLENPQSMRMICEVFISIVSIGGIPTEDLISSVDVLPVLMEFVDDSYRISATKQILSSFLATDSSYWSLFLVFFKQFCPISSVASSIVIEHFNKVSAFSFFHLLHILLKSSNVQNEILSKLYAPMFSEAFSKVGAETPECSPSLKCCRLLAAKLVLGPEVLSHLIFLLSSTKVTGKESIRILNLILQAISLLFNITAVNRVGEIMEILTSRPMMEAALFEGMEMDGISKALGSIYKVTGDSKIILNSLERIERGILTSSTMASSLRMIATLLDVLAKSDFRSEDPSLFISLFACLLPFIAYSGVDLSQEAAFSISAIKTILSVTRISTPPLDVKEAIEALPPAIISGISKELFKLIPTILEQKLQINALRALRDVSEKACQLFDNNEIEAFICGYLKLYNNFAFQSESLREYTLSMKALQTFQPQMVEIFLKESNINALGPAFLKMCEDAEFLASTLNYLYRKIASQSTEIVIAALRLIKYLSACQSFSNWLAESAPSTPLVSIISLMITFDTSERVKEGLRISIWLFERRLGVKSSFDDPIEALSENFSKVHSHSILFDAIQFFFYCSKKEEAVFLLSLFSRLIEASTKEGINEVMAKYLSFARVCIEKYQLISEGTEAAATALASIEPSPIGGGREFLFVTLDSKIKPTTTLQIIYSLIECLSEVEFESKRPQIETIFRESFASRNQESIRSGIKALGKVCTIFPTMGFWTLTEGSVLIPLLVRAVDLGYQWREEALVSVECVLHARGRIECFKESPEFSVILFNQLLQQQKFDFPQFIDMAFKEIDRSDPNEAMIMKGILRDVLGKANELRLDTKSMRITREIMLGKVRDGKKWEKEVSVKALPLLL